MGQHVRPEPVRPPDFDRFWARTRSELLAIDPDPVLRAVEERDGLTRSDLEFTSLGGARLHGYTIQGQGQGQGQGRRPLIVHSHGYGSQVEPMWRWAAEGVNVLGVDIRGFGSSRSALPDPARAGYVLTGIQSPETSVLRSAVCDYAQAVRAAREVFRGTIARLVSHGISFAGGLALMAESVFLQADVLTVGVPTFGWVEGRFFFSRAGSGAEVSAYMSRVPAHLVEDVALVLRYFDTTLFAPQVWCPTLVGLGRHDVVVPAKTVYAIADHLGGPHEILEFPVSHTDLPDEQLWAAFDAGALKLARDGIPDGFGAVRVLKHYPSG